MNKHFKHLIQDAMLMFCLLLIWYAGTLVVSILQIVHELGLCLPAGIGYYMLHRVTMSDTNIQLSWEN